MPDCALIHPACGGKGSRPDLHSAAICVDGREQLLVAEALDEMLRFREHLTSTCVVTLTPGEMAQARQRLRSLVRSIQRCNRQGQLEPTPAFSKLARPIPE